MIRNKKTGDNLETITLTDKIKNKRIIEYWHILRINKINTKGRF